MSKGIARIVSTFSIECTGEPTSSLIQRGRYNLVGWGIAERGIRVEPHELVTRKIGLVAIDRRLEARQALYELGQLHLKRPAAEDALQFGIQHPDVQKKRLIVFLHDPILLLRCIPLVLVLDGQPDGKRCLCLRRFDYGFGQGCVLAGVFEE